MLKKHVSEYYILYIYFENIHVFKSVLLVVRVVNFNELLPYPRSRCLDTEECHVIFILKKYTLINFFPQMYECTCILYVCILHGKEVNFDTWRTKSFNFLTTGNSELVCL